MMIPKLDLSDNGQLDSSVFLLESCVYDLKKNPPNLEKRDDQEDLRTLEDLRQKGLNFTSAGTPSEVGSEVGADSAVSHFLELQLMVSPEEIWHKKVTFCGLDDDER